MVPPVGMSAVGLKPIAEVQFADYIYPGINQLVTEVSKILLPQQRKILFRASSGSDWAYGGGGPITAGK